VLNMLWKGIAKYAGSCRARYLIGGISAASRDENEGVALYEELREKHLVESSFRTLPKPGMSAIRTANRQKLRARRSCSALI